MKEQGRGPRWSGRGLGELRASAAGVPAGRLPSFRAQLLQPTGFKPHPAGSHRVTQGTLFHTRLNALGSLAEQQSQRQFLQGGQRT